MVTCSNCGAEYDESERICPYCGYESAKQAERAFGEKVEPINKERERIISLPKRILSFAKKYIAIILGVIIALTIVIVIIVSLGKRSVKKVMYENERDLINELERLYTDRDYDALIELCKEYRDTDYNRVIGKYSEVASASEMAKDSIDKAVEAYEFISDKDKSEHIVELYYGSALSNFYRNYVRIDNMITDNWTKGNEDDLRKLQAQMVNDFAEVFGFSEADMDELLSIELDDGRVPNEAIAEWGKTKISIER